ncbi:MAG: dihydroxyacetone kinase subunit DhaL [Anaerolineae bacterium]
MAVDRQHVVEWIQAYVAVVRENRDYLTQLDAAIGDADHGANMDRGFQAVLTKLPTVADKDIGAILKTVGMTLVSTVGGAGGPLYGTLFMQAGQAEAGKNEMSDQDVVAMFEAALKGVIVRGKAEVGDKTMVDTLTPAVTALKAAVDGGAPIKEALQQAAAAAEEGMKGTIPLVARKGRASYLGERSAGHQDPGATSSYLLIKTAAETL